MENTFDPARDGMGIGSKGIGDPETIFVRKFRWTFQASFPDCELEQQFVKLRSRPTLDVEEVNCISNKTWIPGKSSWETITLTYLEVFDENEFLTKLYSLLQETMMVDEKDKPMGDGTLILYDGIGTPIETWELSGLQIESANFGELDFASCEVPDIELTMRYVSARWEQMDPKFEKKKESKGQVKCRLESKDNNSKSS